MRRQMILSALVLGGCIIKAGSGVADGAVAIGIAPGGVIRGYAAGSSQNLPNEDEARRGAIRACRKSYSSSAAAQERCEVVSTFRNKCVSFAVDPENGTPGAGWAVAETQVDADAEALNRCRSTAGTARQSFCVVTDRHCDGTAR